MIVCDMQPTGETKGGVPLYRCSRCNRGPLPSRGGRFAPIKCRNGNGGLGDVVASAIQIVTLGLVKPCGKCRERQARLNGGA